jgi:hypothetical protein
MRPLGHTEARAERKHAIVSIDALLEAYAAYEEILGVNHSYVGTDELYTSACRAIEPLRPSLMELRQFLLHEPGCYAGMFASAGYNLLPEREILFDLDLPELSYLGYRLFMKDLVITGDAGSNVGVKMVGNLMSRGKIGIGSAAGMVGTLTTGRENAFLEGNAMIGVFRPHTNSSSSIVGCKVSFDNEYWYIAPGLRGLLHLPPSERRKRRFLQAITNPERLPYDALYAKLLKTYCPGIIDHSYSPPWVVM